MEFYHNLITEKSFQYLEDLKRRYDFILIGDWAVFLYSQQLKSKDIDIIIDYPELAKIKEEYDVVKNNRLRKYEIKTGEFDIDIYLPHYSELGIDIKEITETVIVRGGFKIPSLEILFLLKLHAFENRRGSVKGQKDELDMLSLAILPEFNWQTYLAMVAKFNFTAPHGLFLDFLDRTVAVKELGLNEQKMSKVKKMIRARCESKK